MANWLVAIGTLALAFVAVFGEWLKAKLFQPDLHLELLDRVGELTFASGPQPVPTRYYHLRLSNRRKLSVANQVQVVIVRIEQEDQSNEPQTTYTIALPLDWQFFRELDPRPWRTVGTRDHIADLLFVRPEGIYLTTMVRPNNFPGFYPTGNAIVLWITVEALSIETASEPLRLQIEWDGEWSSDTEAMAHHLVISPPVVPTAPGPLITSRRQRIRAMLRSVSS